MVVEDGIKVALVGALVGCLVVGEFVGGFVGEGDGAIQRQPKSCSI